MFKFIRNWFKIQERSGTVEAGGVDVAYEARWRQRSRKPIVLFLHGRAFGKDEWVDKGWLDKIALAGHKAVAVDLPGYRDTPESKATPGEQLAGIISAVAGSRPVLIVAPSLSGIHLFQLLEAEGKDNRCNIAGLFLMAPKNAEVFKGLSAMVRIPTTIVWAIDDPLIPYEFGDQLLGKIPGSVLCGISSSEHAFYFNDDPKTIRLTMRSLVKFVRRSSHRR